MSKIIIAMLAVCTAGAAYAGIAYDSEVVSASDDSSMTGALILLALVGAVIASGSMAGMASRGNSTMLPEEPEDN